MDFVLSDLGESSFFTYLSLGNGNFSKVNSNITMPPQPRRIAVDPLQELQSGDVNGDARGDIVVQTNDLICAFGCCYMNSKLYSYISNGDGTFASGIQSDLAFYSTCSNDYDIYHGVSGDFNGDGLIDYFFMHTPTFYRVPLPTYSFIAFPNGDGTFVAWRPDDNYYTYAIVASGDFNGDGNTDFVRSLITTAGYFATGTSEKVFVHLTGGPTTFTETEIQLNFESTKALPVSQGDINGDGLTDFILAEVNDTTNKFIVDPVNKVWTYISNGDGTFTKHQKPINHSGTNIQIHGQGDYDGDGKLDLLVGESDNYHRIQNAETASHLFASKQSPFDLLTKVTNGLGAVTDITYGRITDEAIYQKGSGILFGMDMPTQSELNELDQLIIPTQLDAAFTNNNHLLSINTVVKVETLGHEWEIKDQNKRYLVKYENSILNVYGSSYPIVDIQVPIPVVSRISKDDGVGGMYHSDYTYANARVHLTGRGFLGFQIFDSYDPQMNVSKVEVVRQDFPFIGMTASTEQYADATQTEPEQCLHRVTNTLAFKSLNNGKTAFPFFQTSVEEKWELDDSSSPFLTVTTKNNFDDFGNNLVITVDYGSGSTLTSSNTFDNITTGGKWHLGRLTHATVTSIIPTDTQTRVSGFAYDAASGLLIQEVIEPQHPTLRPTTDSLRDAYGNITKTTLSGPNIITRDAETITVFDSKGRFALTSHNALGHQSISEVEGRFGVVTRLEDANGLATTISYDDFGREILRTFPDSTTTSTTRAWVTDNTPAGAVYKITTQSTQRPSSTIYFDKLNREILTETVGGGGLVIKKENRFNAKGQLTQISENYFEVSTPIWSFSEFDPIGRVIRVTVPDGTVTENIYAGLIHSVINDKNGLAQQNTTIKNNKGQVIETKDNANNSMFFTYDAFGNLKTT